MDPEFLIGSVIRSVLFGRRKSAWRARRYLAGDYGSFLRSSTLLTLASLIWDAFEAAAEPPTRRPGPGPSVPTPPTGPSSGSGQKPPAPPAATEPAAPTVPDSVIASIPPATLRIVRLTIAAARADGTLTDQERTAIVGRARRAGIEAIVEQEIRAPLPLAGIVGGVTDPSMRRDLYVLAFGIVRADEAVTGAERVFLAQLATLLGLDGDTVERLEAHAAEEIDSQPDVNAMPRGDTLPDDETSPEGGTSPEVLGVGKRQEG